MSRSQIKSVKSAQSVKKPSSFKEDLYGSSSNREMRQQLNKKPSNPEKIYNKQSEVNMQLIFEANKDYLMDKIAISEVPKPSKYYHKIPSKTPTTTYNNQFHKINHNDMNQLKLERKDNLANPKHAVMNYASLYSQNFNNSTKQSLQLNKNQNPQKEKAKYIPNQSPAFLQTSYSKCYNGNQNPIPVQSAKVKQIALMGGGKFKGQSTYHGMFKGYESKRSQPIYQSNNKIFMTIDTPKETTYKKEYNSRPRSRVEKSKTIEGTPQSDERKRAISQMSNRDKKEDKTKFKSEYERSFQKTDTKQGGSMRGKNISIMSMQEMKKLIMNQL